MLTATRFADLSSPALGALLASDHPPTLLLPVGAIEPHGPHAPLGTDPLISDGMCVRAAQRLNTGEAIRALVLPALPYGVTRFASAFPGAVHITESTLRALVTDLCLSLTQQGFPRIVVVNNHFEPEQVRTLRDTVAELRATHRLDVAYLDLVRREHAARLTDEFRAGECHAGRYETSLVLADRPELVDTDRMRTLPRVAVDLVAEIRSGARDFAAMGMREAYCGSPADATAREGAATFEVLTDILVELVLSG